MFYGCYVSIDDTDVHINEPCPFDSRWFSHKLNAPGLRYEISLSIITSHLVWVNGPFACGTNPDLLIFRSYLKYLMLSGEKVIADGGYKDDRYVLKSQVMLSDKELHAKILPRHETMNRRLKSFHVLADRFRHKID